ncbi:MAG: hypothetical protein ACLP59_22725 [Bryobacteraceae bacterium]
MSRRPARDACALAVLAALAVFAWTAARIHYAFAGNWTAVFCNGAEFPVPPDLAPATYRFPGYGYDGQFYRYLAHDPFLKKGYFHYVDSASLRFRRMLVPMAAWLLAFGQSKWIDGSYIAIELLFIALGVYWSARWFQRRGRPPAWGLLFMAVPATLASFDRMLVDGPLTALFAGFLLYCDEGRWNRVWLIAMLAALTRETGLLLAAALVLDRLLDRDWRRAARFAVSTIPALAWYAWLSAHLPRELYLNHLLLPGWSLLRRLFWLRSNADPLTRVVLEVTDLLAVTGLILSLALAIVWILKCRRSPVTLSISLFAALAIALATLPGYMDDPFGFTRPISPLLLWIMLEAGARKKWIALAPPLLESVSVSIVFIRPFLAIVRGVRGY